MASNKAAEEAKKRGNSLFEKGKWRSAIDEYTEAIALSEPPTQVYFTNRALCYLKLEKWGDVRNDCEKAIELDRSCVKAYYLRGIAMCEEGCYDPGTQSLTRALELSREADKPVTYFGEIEKELRRHRKNKWQLDQDEKARKLSQLSSYVHDAVEHYTKSTSNSKGAHILSLLNELVAEKSYVREDIPDHLCCKIGFEVFTDPVITPCGVTYEKAIIHEHLTKVGKFDPVTRKPLNASQLVPNLAVREAAERFIRENPWAYDLK